MLLVCRSSHRLLSGAECFAHARYDRSGYIGGTVLAQLIQHPQRSDYEITVHLRSAEKAKGFEKLGLKTALGSLDDVADLEKLASESDIVFQTVGSLQIFLSLWDVPTTDWAHLEFTG